MEPEPILDGGRWIIAPGLGRQDCGPIDMTPPAPAPLRCIVRTGAVNDRGQCAWQDECKGREEANVPFHLAFTLCDLGERLDAARCEIVGPAADLRYGEENRVPDLLFERWSGLRLMQDSLDGRERLRGPRQADDGGASG